MVARVSVRLNRLFLRILNAPDRPQRGAKFEGSTIDNLVEHDFPSFYDWRRDSDAIQRSLAWPLEGLLFDLEHNDLWLESCGSRPWALGAQRAKLARLVASAPPLVPVYGQRFLVKAPSPVGYLVLSVWQADIIVYGSDLRNYLLAEFARLLGEDQIREYGKAVEDVTDEQLAGIPFWGELVLRNSGERS